MFRADLKKVTMVIHDPKGEYVLAAFRKLGATRKQGKALPGYMERDLQEWLQALE